MSPSISLDQAALLASAWRWNLQSASKISYQILALQSADKQQAFGPDLRDQLLQSMIRTIVSSDCSNLLRDCLLMMLMEQATELFRTSSQLERSLSQLIQFLSNSRSDLLIWSSLAYSCTNIIISRTKSLPRTCHQLTTSLMHQLQCCSSSAVSQQCLKQLQSETLSIAGQQCQCPILIPSLYCSPVYSALSSLHSLMRSECFQRHRGNLQQTALELYQTRYRPVYGLMALITLQYDPQGCNDQFCTLVQYTASDPTVPLTIRWIFTSWMKGAPFLPDLIWNPFDPSPYIAMTKFRSLLIDADEHVHSCSELLSQICEYLPNSCLSRTLSKTTISDSIIQSLSLHHLIQLTLLSDLTHTALPHLLTQMALIDNSFSMISFHEYLTIIVAASRSPNLDHSITLKLCQMCCPLAMTCFQYGHQLVSALKNLWKYEPDQACHLLHDISKQHVHIHIRDRASIVLYQMQPEFRKLGHRMVDIKPDQPIELP